MIGATTAKSDASISIVDGSSSSDYGYSPSSITITAGDTLTWTNDGTVPEGHTVTGDGFDSGTLSHGQTYSHTFTTAGSFPYVCTLHPFMKGSVTVDAAPPSTGGSGPPANANPTGGGTSGTPADPGGGTSPTDTSPTTGPTSESSAVDSPDAAGTAGSLPTTGSSTWVLGVLGAVLLAGGLGLALRPSPRVRIYV